MDYCQLIRTHTETNADATIAAIPVDRQGAAGLGVMRVDETGRVRGFVEKPTTDEQIQPVLMDPKFIDQRGIESRGRECLASMGIYVFKRDVLVDVLKSTTHQDFGREIFPTLINPKNVQVHLFDGYWEDIGTIDAFYRANLELATDQPPFDLISAEAPLYSRARFLPPTRLDGCHVGRSLIADGCRISQGATIENSVIGLRCTIGENVTIRDSIIMGVDEYETIRELHEDDQLARPPIGIGSDAVIIGAIVDKNCRIGRGVKIEYKGTPSSDVTEYGPCTVRDGIPIVLKDAVVPDGWSIPG
jgi:glucose-1-phosphate adenylyltransferase